MGVLTTGFNAPAVDLIAMLRPTKSAGLYFQMAGRGTRLAEGKENCLEFKLVRASGSSDRGDRSKAPTAPMESFFGSLKTEMVHCAHFRSRRGAKAALFEHIAIFYNRQRRHFRIGSRTPEQARIDMTRAETA